MKSITHKQCFQCFLYFSSYTPAYYLIVKCFQQVLFCYPWIWPVYRVLGGEEHFTSFLNLELSKDIQFYALQLVEVSTVFVFLGRGLLVKDTESQEDQYMFTICPCWTFWSYLTSDCYFLCLQLSKPLYSLSYLESINLLCRLGRGLL